MTIYRHAVHGITPGLAWSCTLHSSGTLSLASAQSAWIAAWTELWNGVAAPADDIKQLFSTALSCTSASTAILDPGTLRETANTNSSLALVGTATSTQLPVQNSVNISWNSALPGRGGRGRLCLPAFASGFLSSSNTGLLTTAAQTIVSLAGTNLLASLNGAALTPSLLGRITKAVTPITGGSVDNIIDTQRRRRDKLVGTRITFV